LYSRKKCLPNIKIFPEIAQDGWFIDFLRAVQAVERGTGKVEPSAGRRRLGLAAVARRVYIVFCRT
jgi:hypothetical protein